MVASEFAAFGAAGASLQLLHVRKHDGFVWLSPPTVLLQFLRAHPATLGQFKTKLTFSGSR